MTAAKIRPYIEKCELCENWITHGHEVEWDDGYAHSDCAALERKPTGYRFPSCDEGVAGTVLAIADEWTKNADHYDDCDLSGKSKTCIVCRIARFVKAAK